MKKLMFSLFAILIIGKSQAQFDIGVTQINAPSSGCNLSAGETVTIKLFNYGADINTPFNVSYSINGGPAVVEAVNATILQNSSYTYSFTTPANLSVASSYTFTAGTLYPGDINPNNDDVTGFVVTNYTTSVGGTLASSATVCAGSNSGTINLSGNTGSVLNWESSTDGGSTWNVISNNSTSQSYSNLSTSTSYRVKVQNGLCPSVNSSTVNITVTPPSVGGAVNTSTTVCSGTNSGTLTLSGHTGSVLNWQFSTNGGASWTNIANTTTTQNYLNLTATRLYRAIVRSGTCTNATSAAATVTVNPATVAGTIAPATSTVCAGSNGATLTLTGNTGSISQWEFSTDGGVSWNPITNTSNTFNYANLSTTTLYRALVQSNPCASAYTNTVSITVNPATVAGSTTTNTTVCSGSNSGNVTLSGHTGNVVRWESSIDGGASWSNIVNTTTTQAYTNITSTTLYRALVQASGCNNEYSNATQISVDSTSLSGTVASSATVCAGTNSGSVNVSGFRGNITWQQSINAGASWNNTGNNASLQPYFNLSTNTAYRAIVKYGVCASVTSNSVTINVDAATVAGSLASSDTVCSNSNGGTLTLSGHTGSVLNWEQSVNGGLSWTNIANTSTSQTYTNLNQTTFYRAIVKNGVCASVVSTPVFIDVEQALNAGTLATSDTVCISSNAGVISINGSNGAVGFWEYSTNAGASWNNISNTSVLLSFNNLSQTTYYRAVFTGLVCPNDTTNIVTIKVDSASIGGSITTSDTVCAGINGGTLILTGHYGSVLDWEMSNDGGINWNSLGNTSLTQAYSNLNQTTVYRTIVKNGVCSQTYATAATITTEQAAVTGNILSPASVCYGTNSGVLTLVGYNGSVLNWNQSSDGGTTWFPIANSSNTLNYSNLTDTTWYNVIFDRYACPDDTTLPVMITVDSLSNGGNLASSDTVCAGANNGTLMLSNYYGSIQAYEYSTDNGATWSSLSSSSASYVYNNISSNTLYRATVKNGVCPADYSDTVTVTAIPYSVAGVLSQANPVCEIYNAGSLQLSNTTGTIITWISSNDGGMSWTNITNTNSIHNFTNLTDTTWFAAIVQNGLCPADTSLPSVVIVYPKPVAQFTANDTICFGTPVSFLNGSVINNGLLTLHSWYFGDNTNSVQVNPNHTYSDTGSFNVVLVELSNLGCTDTAFGNILVYPNPKIMFSVDHHMAICEGDSLNIKVDSIANANLLWNTGLSGDSIWVDSAYYYSLTATDTLTGCFSKDSVHVIVNPLPTAYAGADTSISLGETIWLNGSGGIQYDWWPGSVNDTLAQNTWAIPVNTTEYILTVTDINGCSDKDTIYIEVKKDYNLVVPTLITPNGDGYNDTWTIKNIDLYPENEVLIFNREGQKIFGMSEYDNSWDGRYRNNAVPDGTYYFVLKFTDTGHIVKGAITVVRNK
jgi:gliding motility-associated-like protein